MLWALMILVGIVYGALNGTMKEITEAMLESAGEAVSLCIATGGVMAFWTGMMEVAESAGLIRSLTKKMDPFIRFLFPAIPKEHEARKYISLNIIANIGLGWAATPAGLKAMEALAAMEKQRSGPGYEENRASNEMCTFLILNISSLQLIPVNMIAYRQQYGSVDAAGIIAPAIIATCISTAAAIIFCKVKDQKSSFRSGVKSF